MAPAILYYADDFTGATDTLATAARGGLRTMLFLGLPRQEHIERAGPLDCIGIAGAARSMNPPEMQAELAPIAELFRRIGARVLHYKTCSTFDSAPEVGSIGAAIGSLHSAAGQPWTAVVGGQPNLERYCLFGNLFAAAGSGGTVYRIDRHPTMSRHPVTPMHEADLRIHLALQGMANVALVPYTAYGLGPKSLGPCVDELLASKPDAVLFDVAEAQHLSSIGAELWRRAREASLLVAGPSSVVEALASQLETPAATASAVPPATGPVFVMAGSLSPVTAAQVALAKSYDVVWLDATEMGAGRGDAREAAARTIAQGLQAGRNVLACTSRPGGVPAVGDPKALARAGGDLLARVLALAPVRRVGIAGGDTSSLAVQALEAWGLSYQGALGPGTALCRLHSDQAALDGVDLMLKGGQMGTPDIFERLVQGAA